MLKLGFRVGSKLSSPVLYVYANTCTLVFPKYNNNMADELVMMDKLLTGN